MNNFNNVREIAVLLPNKKFFGAQIVLIPFFKRLKELFPQARIYAFSPGPSFGVLKELNLINDFFISRKGVGGFRGTVKKIRRVRPDLLFTLRRKSERDWLINIFSGAGEKIGFKRKWSPLVYDKLCSYDKNTYRATNFLKLLQFYDKESIDCWETRSRYPTRNLSAWLIPCGSKKEKLWPLDNYIELAKKIAEKFKYRIIFVLGPAEADLKEYIDSRLDNYMNPEFIVSAGVEELLQKAQRCALACTNDCGPGHIAQISGAPTLVLFGKNANVKEWVNSRGRVEAVISEDGPIDAIAVDKVFSKAKAIR